ncbi:MAG: (Fe-S)-binding protein [Nitrospirota bacterium]
MKESVYITELSKCVRCGSCKAFCPTYDEDTTEAMGARGRLTLLRGLSTGQLKPSKILNDRIFSCILCGACSGLCPPGVDITEAVYHGRSLLKNTDKKRLYLRLLTRFSTKRPKLSFRLLSMAQHILFPYLLKRGVLPFQPELPESPLKDGHQVYTVSKKKGRVAVFTGCIVNFLYPYLGESLISILQRLGYEVILPIGEVCCGVPLRTLGLEEEAIELAKKNIRIFSRLNVEAILSLCPTCTLAIKVEYPKLIGDGIERAMDISSFLLDKMDSRHSSLPGLALRSRAGVTRHYSTATYHDPCHLNYGLGIKREPREIIKNIGIDLIETEGERCCGSGGLFSLSYREISEGLLEKRIEDFKKTGAETIITSCPGCVMQLSHGVKDTPVLHLIEVLDKAYYKRSNK